jgi:hypothetical protein
MRRDLFSGLQLPSLFQRLMSLEQFQSTASQKIGSLEAAYIDGQSSVRAAMLSKNAG